MWGQPGSILSSQRSAGTGAHPRGPRKNSEFVFPTSTLAYFQFVFAAITPILMLGSVLGRINFKAWIPFVALWTVLVYTINAFLIWGGGYFAQQGALDFSGGYVIHLAAGVSGFVAAAVIGPRLQRDREVDAPNNLAMVAVGAGLLWLGWNGFNGGDPYLVNDIASAAVLNTNLCTAVAFLVWVAWDYMTGRKPSLIGSVNGMIVGLVAITPGRRFRQRLGRDRHRRRRLAIVYFALNYLSRMRPFRNVDDTLGVVYTHGFAGLAGGLLVAVFANNGDGGRARRHDLRRRPPSARMAGADRALGDRVLRDRDVHPAQAGRPGRAAADDRRGNGEGDLAVHGHEVYPSDVPSLGLPGWGSQHHHQLPAELLTPAGGNRPEPPSALSRGGGSAKPRVPSGAGCGLGVSRRM